MRKRIIESIDDFKKEEPLKTEFGSVMPWSLPAGEDKPRPILFRFDDKLKDVIEWGINNISAADIENISEIKTGEFISQIRRGKIGGLYLPIDFSVMKGKSTVVILHTSDITGEERDKTVVLSLSKDSVDVTKASEILVKTLEPVFDWVRICEKVYEYNKMDQDLINDLFADAFDDADDYSVSVNNDNLFKVYLIAISIGQGRSSYVGLTKNVISILKDMIDATSHLEEYDVSVSFDTRRPTFDTFPEKNSTFYSSNAIIVRIGPK
jgi:hypothetical protein